LKERNFAGGFIAHPKRIEDNLFFIFSNVSSLKIEFQFFKISKPIIHAPKSFFRYIFENEK